MPLEALGFLTPAFIRECGPAADEVLRGALKRIGKPWEQPNTLDEMSALREAYFSDHSKKKFGLSKPVYVDHPKKTFYKGYAAKVNDMSSRVWFGHTCFTCPMQGHFGRTDSSFCHSPHAKP